MGFLSSNAVLLLGIAGAAVSLVASLSKVVQEKQSRRVVAGLAILGFLTLVGQQLIKAGLDAQASRQRQAADEQRRAAEKDRDLIIAEIRGTVTHTAGVVDDLSRRLSGATLEEVGERLVAVDPSAREVEDFLSFGKGPVSAWDAYARWVGASGGGATRKVLTFDVNASRNYQVPLTLAYLFTSPATQNELRRVVESGAQGPWYREPFVDRILLDWKGVDYVLFRDGRTRRAIAYAPARAFAGELLAHQRVGDAARVEEVLNRPGEDASRALAGLFPSVRTSVVEEADVAAVVKTMLERRWPQCVAGGAEARYVVSLENVVRAAEAGGRT